MDARENCSKLKYGAVSSVAVVKARIYNVARRLRKLLHYLYLQEFALHLLKGMTMYINTSFMLNAVFFAKNGKYLFIYLQSIE